MKFFRLIRRTACMTAALLLCVSVCLAENVFTAEDAGLDLTDAISIHYPALTGDADETLLKEIDAGARAKGGVFPQAKSEWFRAEQRKAGAEIWFGAFVGGIVVEDGRVKGVVVVMEDGTRGLVACRNAIDSTGNAELPAMAGEETEFITDDDLSVQGVGHARHPLGSDYANSDIGFVDDTDAADVFYFALRSRLSLPDDTWDQAQVIDSRERRRMIGAFYMSAADVACSRTYPDVITRTYSNFDSHGQTRDDLFFIQDPGHKPMYVNLPYRCFCRAVSTVCSSPVSASAHTATQCPSCACSPTSRTRATPQELQPQWP